MSLHQKLYEKIKAEGRLSYGDMCQFTAEEGYKISTAERRLREYMEDGKIHPEWATSKRNTKYISAYRYQPQMKTVERVIVEGNVARVVHTTITA